MIEEQQNQEDLKKILNYLRLNKPEQATEEEALRCLNLMKAFAEDLEFAELLHKALEEDKAKRDAQNEQNSD